MQFQSREELEGKVMFEMEEEKLCLLSSLKTIERLFLKVVYEPNITIKYRSGKFISKNH